MRPRRRSHLYVLKNHTKSPTFRSKSERLGKSATIRAGMACSLCMLWMIHTFARQEGQERMLSWMPQIETGSGPKYLAIAEALLADVQSGRLKPGHRLPPQRQLAKDLKVDL